MKTLPPRPNGLLDLRAWDAYSDHAEKYAEQDLLDAIESLQNLWKRVKWKSYSAAGHTGVKEADKLEKIRKSTATGWSKRAKNVLAQLDDIERRARKLLETIPKTEKEARKPLVALLAEITKYRKHYPLKFDDSDFQEAIGALRGGGKKGKKKGGAGDDDDDDDDDDSGGGKAKNPIDVGAFRKAAAAIATSAKSGGPPSSTVAKIHGDALTIIGGHNKDQRAQNRLFKSLMPLGGDKIAKQVANGLKDRAAAKIADSLPDDVAAKLKKVGFNPGGKNENKQKLDKIAKDMGKSTGAIRKALETIYKHLGSLTKAANGNAMMNKKLDETEKLLDIMSRIYGDIEAFTGTVTEAAELMKTGKPTNGIRLEKLEADRLAKAFGLLERWAISWQRMV